MSPSCLQTPFVIPKNFFKNNELTNKCINTTKQKKKKMKKEKMKFQFKKKNKKISP